MKLTKEFLQTADDDQVACLQHACNPLHLYCRAKEDCCNSTAAEESVREKVGDMIRADIFSLLYPASITDPKYHKAYRDNRRKMTVEAKNEIVSQVLAETNNLGKYTGARENIDEIFSKVRGMSYDYKMRRLDLIKEK